MIDERKYFRINLDIPGVLLLEKRDPLSIWIRDISCSGLGLELDPYALTELSGSHHFPVAGRFFDTQIRFHDDFGEQLNLEGTFRVRHCRWLNRHHYHLGLQFRYLDPHSQQDLANLIGRLLKYAHPAPLALHGG